MVKNKRVIKQVDVDDFSDFDNTAFSIRLEEWTYDHGEKMLTMVLGTESRHDSTHVVETTVFYPTAEGVSNLASAFSEITEAVEEYYGGEEEEK